MGGGWVSYIFPSYLFQYLLLFLVFRLVLLCCTDKKFGIQEDSFRRATERVSDWLRDKVIFT